MTSTAADISAVGMTWQYCELAPVFVGGLLLVWPCCSQEVVCPSRYECFYCQLVTNPTADVSKIKHSAAELSRSAYAAIFRVGAGGPACALLCTLCHRRGAMPY